MTRTPRLLRSPDVALAAFLGAALVLSGAAATPSVSLAASGPSVAFTSPSSSVLIGSSLRLGWIEWAVPGVPIVARRVVTHAAVPDDGACETATYSIVATDSTSDSPRYLAVDGLRAGRCYYWTVRVTDLDGASAMARSMTVRVGTTDPMVTFAFPASGAATDGPPGSYTLSWDETSTAGIVSRLVTEQAAPVASGRSCDRVDWGTTRTFSPTTQTQSVGSLGGGSTRMCYRYGLLVRDANGRVSWAQSGALLVTTEPPWCAYGDVPTPEDDDADWATTLLDPIYRVGAAYAPPDMIATDGIPGVDPRFRIRRVAYADLKALVIGARAAGAPIELTSGYRSYASQRVTYELFVKGLGPYGGLLRAARPGHSEHQLGTTIDVKSTRGPSPQEFADWAATKTGAWLRDNAWRYGWLMTYPKDTSPGITCYEYEPWHYRYVGRAMAAAVEASGLTLREFLWRTGSLSGAT